MSRAKVIFTDGFHTSPTVETTSKNLRERIVKALEKHTASPAVLSTLFIIQSTLDKEYVTIHNTPEGRSFGGTVAMLRGEGFWPGGGNEAGIFLVWIAERKVEYFGGTGFEGDPEFTKSTGLTEEL
jgi:hypothetical protein